MGQNAAASSQRRQEEAWTSVVMARGDGRQMDLRGTQRRSLKDAGILQGCRDIAGMQGEKGKGRVRLIPRFLDLVARGDSASSPGNTAGG